MLSDLREIKHLQWIRFHTAAFIHNPMRITRSLALIFKKHSVTELGIHILHESQVTEEFREAIHVFDEIGYGSILKYTHVPFLRGINDTKESLLALNGALIDCGVSPYYYLHGMPWTLLAEKFRTSVFEMAELFASLKRNVSNLLVSAEPTIVARGGKKLIPLERNIFKRPIVDLESIRVWNTDDTYSRLLDYPLKIDGIYAVLDGTPEFLYVRDFEGNPIIIFKSWKGVWEAYLDSQDAYRMAI